MKRKLFLLAVCLASTLLFSKNDPSKLNEAKGFFNNQKLSFAQNKGQLSGEDANQVTYFLNRGNMTFYLLKNGIAYQFTKRNETSDQNNFQNPEELLKSQGKAKNNSVETYRMDMILQGANPNPKITTEKPLNGTINYNSKNINEVHQFSQITYHDIYPNIDWVVYIKNQNVEYDFVIHPNGNPNQIKFKNKWAEKMQLNNDGSISLNCKLGKITQQAPISFQNGKNIATESVLKNNILSFKVSPYNRNQTLTIDPEVFWSTYFGGTGLDAGTSCVVDGSNNIYLAGYTSSNSNIASGGYQSTFAGGNSDAFLAKFNNSGALLWATYYGGDQDDKGNSVALDAAGNVYLAGMTYSSSNIASSGAYQTNLGGYDDAFLVKFDSNGNRIWATYFGGEFYDEGLSCATDHLGNVYLAGDAWSSFGIATAGSHQQNPGGATDGFLAKFDSNGNQIWATYYGGELWETGYCAVDVNNNVYLAGFTSSTTNISTTGSHQPTRNAFDDAYLVKFDSNGVRQWGTYYGGSDYDWAYFVDTDSQGNVYLDGHTGSPLGISTPGSYQPNIAGSYDAFLVKFNGDGTRIWGTYYGGTNEERASACKVDGNDNVILTGYTRSDSGIASTGAYQTTYNGSQDAFAAKFDSNGARIWGTYIGGTDEDYGAFCTTDASGNVYLTGYTNSATNISSVGSFQENYGGSRDAYLVKLYPNGTLHTTEAAIHTFEIYPNPVKDFVNIRTTQKIKSIILLDSTGRILKKLDHPAAEISLSTIPKGIYILSVNFENGTTETKKIIKN